MSFVWLLVAIVMFTWLVWLASTPEAKRSELRAHVHERLVWLTAALNQLNRASEDVADIPSDFHTLIARATQCRDEVAKIDLLQVQNNLELIRLQERLDVALEEVSHARGILGTVVDLTEEEDHPNNQ
jgi:biopolymer transport protein ExbB/TolQ